MRLATLIAVTYALELPIPVNLKGSTIRYSFTTEEGDVNFGVFFRKVDEKGVGGKGGGEDGEENEEEEVRYLLTMFLIREMSRCLL